jgi:hypothetical protein
VGGEHDRRNHADVAGWSSEAIFTAPEAGKYKRGASTSWLGAIRIANAFRLRGPVRLRGLYAAGCGCLPSQRQMDLRQLSERQTEKREIRSRVNNLSINQSKMLFGFALLVVLCVLALSVATGHVQDSNSFGPIITMLGTLSGAFAGWAFRDRPDDHLEHNGGTPKAAGSSNTNGVAQPKPPAAPSNGEAKK